MLNQPLAMYVDTYLARERVDRYIAEADAVRAARFGQEYDRAENAHRRARARQARRERLGRMARARRWLTRPAVTGPKEC